MLLTKMGILLALVVAAPMVCARSKNGAAPQDVSGTIPPETIARYPGHCDFPMQLELSGKTKSVEQGTGSMIITSPVTIATITNLANGEQATFDIASSSHKSILENGNVKTVMTGRNFALDPVAAP